MAKFAVYSKPYKPLWASAPLRETFIMSISCPTCLTENPQTNSNCFACGTPLAVQETKENQASSPLSHHLPPGTVLTSQNNQYRIETTLGQGGFGITYKGIELKTSTPVAIKENWPDNGSRQDNSVLWPSSLPPKERNEQITRFIQEAQNIYQCKHANIVEVYDWFTGNNTAYIAMEFLPGQSLYHILQSQGPLPELKVKKYLLEIAHALKFIHSKQLLHRDIKPENILIDSQDRAVLIDFGNARAFIANQTQRMTQILTPGYAPIEQYGQKGRPGPWVDIYALCASMYELLTGQLPPSAPDRLQSDLLVLPSNILPHIDPTTEKVILAGMKIKVEERFQSADDLIKGLLGEYIPPTLTKARDLVRTGDLSTAVQAYEQCLHTDPDNSETVVELAMVSMYLDESKAEIAASRGIQMAPNDGRSYGVLGLISCRQSNWSQAMGHLQKAARLAPNESWINANLAWALGKTGKWQEAQTAAKKAVQLDPDSTFALGLQAWIGSNLQQWKPVIRYARQAIFKSQQNPELSSWIYPCLTVALDRAVVTKQGPDLERCLQQFMAAVPQSAFPWGFKGWQQSRLGLWQEALASFQGGSQQPEVPGWIILNQAIVLEQRQDIAGAVQVYQTYIDKFGDHAFALYRLGTLSGQMGAWEEGRSYLEHATQLKPDYGEAYHNLGWVLMNIRDSQGEVENATQVLSAYRQAVQFYQKQGKLKWVQQIKQAFKKAGIPSCFSS